MTFDTYDRWQVTVDSWQFTIDSGQLTIDGWQLTISVAVQPPTILALETTAKEKIKCASNTIY